MKTVRHHLRAQLRWGLQAHFGRVWVGFERLLIRNKDLLFPGVRNRPFLIKAPNRARILRSDGNWRSVPNTWKQQVFISYLESFKTFPNSPKMSLKAPAKLCYEMVSNGLHDAELWRFKTLIRPPETWRSRFSPVTLKISPPGGFWTCWLRFRSLKLHDS